MHAVRFHHRPLRYLLTRFVSARAPALALGRLGCVSLDAVEPPTLPGDDWVRVAPALSGICGSDTAAITAHDSFTLEPFGAFPFTFGHENVGRITERGRAVADWNDGDRVIVNPMLGCAQRGLSPCVPCANGEYGLCRRTREGVAGAGPMIGFAPRVGGGWAGSFVAHRSQLHGARQLTDDVAVLTDPLASALRPVLLHPPRDDDTVLVIGAGTIGLLTVVALRACGWRGVIAVLGRYPFQLERAAAAGANHVFRTRDAAYRWAAALPGARALAPSLAARFVEGGPSLVFDTVGRAGSLRDAIALTREAGRIVLVGAAARARVDWTRVWYRQLTIAGALVYGNVPGPNGPRDVYDAAIDVLAAGHVESLQLVTHRFELGDFRAAVLAALEKRRTRSIKVVLAP